MRVLIANSMDGIQIAILKVKKRIDGEALDKEKVLKYLRALDEIPIGFDILKSTGIGKSVNNLKKHGGNIAVLSKALVKKWKTLVPAVKTSPSSPCHYAVQDAAVQQSSPPIQPSVVPRYDKKSLHKQSMQSQAQPTTTPARMENYRDNRKQKAPSIQLCDLGFVSMEPVSKKAKKTKTCAVASEKPSSAVKSLPSAQEIDACLLPDIQPNYVPQRPQRDLLDDTSPRKNRALVPADISADLLSSRKSKTQVFSGRRSASKSGVVCTLYDMCIRVLIENIEALYDTGGVPFDILEPVLAKCTPAQLWSLEDYNPYFIEDSGLLWKNHCHKDFKGLDEAEHDDWRALYLERYEERERRLKSINERINASQAAKNPVRQVKLAYIQTEAKAPPQIRRKQMKHGTGPIIAPPTRIRPHSSSTSTRIRPHSSTSTSNSTATSSRSVTISPRKSKTTALMKKVKQMGNAHRSRARTEIIRQ